MSQASRGPLSGVRVIELATEISGPYCGKLLVDAGAEVLKLEPPGGDPLRRWTGSGHPLAEGEDGALFQFLNASKRSAVADLESAAGRDLVRGLAGTADLVIEDLGAAERESAGIGLEALQARNPALSVVSISPWGESGPWAHRPATEFTLQAAVGSIAYRGLPERGPVAAGGRIGEWIAGSYASVGAIAAHLSGANTGIGQHVDVSMFEAMVLSLTVYHDLNSQFFEGPLAQAVETPSIEPAKDGWVGFCTVTGQQWKDFCALIGRQDVGEDERFYDATARMQHLDFIHGIIREYTRANNVDDIVEVASLMRIPVNPIGDGRTLPQIDHFVEREVFVRGPGGFLQPRVPYRLGDAAVRPFGAAPALGADQAEIEAEPGSCSPALGEPRGGDARPFAGLRVVDLTAFWAGPVATCVLADLGADVVKVESIQRPDGMRFAGAVRNDTMWEWAPIFHGANTGKRDITLRLDSDEGMDLLKRLIRNADVVIENFSVRVLENFGLDWEAIHALNPRAILVRMPAFGLDGPWRDRVGFAMNIEQISGLAWRTGYPDMPLVVRGACDPLGGMHTVFALALALEQRRESGQGLLVEVPLVEPALNIAAEQVIEYSAYDAFIEERGNRNRSAAPQGVYRCSDGTWIALAVATGDHWRALRVALGGPAWAKPALDDLEARRELQDEIDGELAAWCAQRPSAEAVDSLVGAGVPAHACINAHGLSPNPQLEHRGFFQVMEHPFTGKMRYPGLPMSFSNLPRALHKLPPPTLGQHTEQVLRDELGLTDEEIEGLRERQVIGTRPSFM